MERLSTKKLVMCALFAALACVATMSIRIPTPATGGYIHPGDAVVILCGIFMGPAEAFLAAGIGSCMADLLGGYYIHHKRTGSIFLQPSLPQRYSPGKARLPCRRCLRRD